MTGTKLGLGAVAAVCVAVLAYFVFWPKDQPEDTAPRPPIEVGIGDTPADSPITSLRTPPGTPAADHAGNDDLMARLRQAYLDADEPAPGDATDSNNDRSETRRTHGEAPNGSRETSPIDHAEVDEAAREARLAADRLTEPTSPVGPPRFDDEPATLDTGRMADARDTRATATDIDSPLESLRTARGDESAAPYDTRKTEDLAAPDPVPGNRGGESAAIPGTYRIEEGDTLSGIAQRYYGRAAHWDAIARANPGVDPGRLRIGQEITLPPADSVVSPDRVTATAEPTIPAPPPGPGVVYTVGEGDTLWTIAEQHYGNGLRWKAIYEVNQSIIGSDPGRLRQGTRLRLPPNDQL